MKKLLVSVFVISSFLAIFTAASTSVFTDFTSNTGNAFSTGLVKISLEPTSTLFNVANMAPGSSATKKIYVYNNGTVDLKYIMDETLTAGNPSLEEMLRCKIKNSSGRVFYDGALRDAATVEWLEVRPQDRGLLYFTVSLPSEVGNEFQETSCTVAFNFYAQQAD